MTDRERANNDLFYPSRDTVCLHPFGQFSADHHAIVDQFFSVIQLILRIDDNRLTAAKALLPGAKSEGERKRLEDAIADPGFTLIQLKRHNIIKSQILTNNILNAFQRCFL